MKHLSEISYDSAFLEPLAEAISSAQTSLSQFALNKAFDAQIELAFGDKVDRKKLSKLREQWVQGNITELPKVKIRSTAEINGANGAFSLQTGKIYLAEEFLFANESDTEAVAKIIIEEYGHYVDNQINSSDILGDEGAIFSAVVRGEELTEEELRQLRTEDDSAVVVIDEAEIAIEQDLLGDIFGNNPEVIDRRSPTTGDPQIDALVNLFTHQNPYNWSGNLNIPNERRTDFIAKFKTNKITYSFADDIPSAVITQVERILKDVTSIANLSFKPASRGEGMIHYRLSNDIPKGTEAFADPEEIFNPGEQKWNFAKFTWNKTKEPEYFYASADVVLPKGKIAQYGKFGTSEYATLIHETLHALGLQHPGNYNGVDEPGVAPFLDFAEDNTNNTVMSYAGNNRRNATLMPLDLKALQYLYGAASHNSKDNTYTFSRISEFQDGTDSWGDSGTLTTIWDSGGVDTLDFQNLSPILFSKDYFFDLRQGGLITELAILNKSKYKGKFFDPNVTEDTNGNGFLDTGEDDNGDGRITKGIVVDTDKFYYTTAIGTRISLETLVENFVNSPGNDYISANEAANVFSGYTTAKNWGDDTIVGTNAADTLFFSGSTTPKISSKSRSDTLVLDLYPSPLSSSAIGSITLVNYYEQSANKRIKFDNDNGVSFFFGDSEKNSLGGSPNQDLLNGGAGSDTLTGGNGNDTVFGGEGNDRFFFSNGSDTLDGGAGIDFVDFGNIQGFENMGASIVLDGATFSTDNYGNSALITNIENVDGSRYYDQIIGGAGNNSLDGKGGNDTISGFAGNDIIGGGAGNDFLYGGHEVEFSPSGNDFINGGSGADLIDGGDGIDNASYSTSAKAVSVSLIDGTGTGGDAEGDTLVSIEYLIGSDGGDTLVGNNTDNNLVGIKGNDSLVGNEGNDTLFGQDDNDTLIGGAGNDTLNGGEGIDTVSYESLENSESIGVSVDLRIVFGSDSETQTSSDGTGNFDQLISIEDAIGSQYDDALVGSNEANNIQGELGNDIVSGFGGNDILSGGEGNDELYGGQKGNQLLVSGNDFLNGGLGADLLDGGDGIDTASYSTSTEAVSVSLVEGSGTEGDAEGDTLVAIENVFGSDNEDILVGNSTDNRLVGIKGNDSLMGNDGNDTLFGQDDNDTLIGGAGNDSLAGGNGDDFLDGGNGNDTINGGEGIDTVGYELMSTGMNVNLNAGTANIFRTIGILVVEEQLIGIENVNGSNNSDILTGNSQKNVLNGLEGDDTLVGSRGADNLSGGNGNDTYELSAENAAGSEIYDTAGIDSLMLTNDILSLSQPTVNITGLAKENNTLFLDLNQNGSISPEQDLSILNYFDESGTGAGNGYIEQVANLSGDEIFNFFSQLR